MHPELLVGRLADVFALQNDRNVMANSILRNIDPGKQIAEDILRIDVPARSQPAPG